MIKTIGKLTLVGMLAALVVGVPLTTRADDATTPSTNAPATPAPAPKAKGSNFRGTVGSVDKTAQTITVKNKNGEERIFGVTSETKITRDGKPATLDDAVVGDSVSGSYSKSDDGKMVAKRVTLKAAK